MSIRRDRKLAMAHRKVGHRANFEQPVIQVRQDSLAHWLTLRWANSNTGNQRIALKKPEVLPKVRPTGVSPPPEKSKNLPAGLRPHELSFFLFLRSKCPCGQSPAGRRFFVFQTQRDTPGKTGSGGLWSNTARWEIRHSQGEHRNSALTAGLPPVPPCRRRAPRPGHRAAAGAPHHAANALSRTHGRILP